MKKRFVSQRLLIADSVFQRIFAQSKVNGAFYRGDELQPQQVDLPRDTWFQRRLKYIRALEQDDGQDGGTAN